MTRQVTPFHFIGSTEAGREGSRGARDTQGQGRHGSRGDMGAGETEKTWEQGDRIDKRERRQRVVQGDGNFFIRTNPVSRKLKWGEGHHSSSYSFSFCTHGSNDLDIDRLTGSYPIRIMKYRVSRF